MNVLILIAVVIPSAITTMFGLIQKLKFKNKTKGGGGPQELLRSSKDSYSIDGRRPIGYWDDNKHNPTKAINLEDWKDSKEQMMVLDYLKEAYDDDQEDDDDDLEDNNGLSNPNRQQRPHVLKSWRGLAFCQICGESVGNSDHGDLKFNWPEGYTHYIKVHNIKPPQLFIDHVVKKAQQQQKHKKKVTTKVDDDDTNAQQDMKMSKEEEEEPVVVGNYDDGGGGSGGDDDSNENEEL